MSRFIGLVALAAAVVLSLPPAQASAAVSEGVLCAPFGNCDTYDPDVTCYASGVTWQFTCTSGSPWCNGY